MTKLRQAFALVGLAAGLSGYGMAADLTGYIMDQNCSTKPAMKGNVACAERCIKGGAPAVLVTDEGKVYKISNQDKVTQFAGKKVVLSGNLNADTIEVSKVATQ